MDSKGNVRHFFGVLFAWRGFESCCCSNVSEALRQRLSKLETLAFVGSNPAACCCSAVWEGARPMALQRKASWQRLLLTRIFCDLDGALPF